MAALRLAVVVAALVLPVAAQPRGLTGVAPLARAYDAIFDADFDRVPQLLAHACPPAPPEACRLLSVVSRWWQIQLDPHDRSHDAVFGRLADEAIAAIEAWTRREPQRAEAWFYLGGAYGSRAQWRATRGHDLLAAQDGRRIKGALERAVALEPGLHDAYFGIGLYHYYADVAPAAAKILRWLLLMPGGDREAGLGEMLRARSGGQLLRSEADYQLHVIYRWHEKQPRRAIELLQALRARHPRNPHFPQLIAETQERALADHAASLQTWTALLDAAREGRIARPQVTETRARLGVALQLYRLGRAEAALPHVQQVIDAAPHAPVGALAVAHLQRGYALDRLGRRGDAIAAYRAALAANPSGDPLKIAGHARAGIRAPHR